MARQYDDVVSTRLRLPKGLHRMVQQAAKRNGRSLNSEVLWCIAQQYGDEAQKYISELEAAQRELLEGVVEKLKTDPELLARVIENVRGKEKR